jgi:hypothetical protein
MSTTVNLYIGEAVGATDTNSIALVLTSPYTEPGGHLLILRSSPDVPPVSGTMGATEQRDTSVFQGTATVGATTGTLSETENHDGVAFSASFDGVSPRTATIQATDHTDGAAFDATYTLAIRIALAPLEQHDAGPFLGGATPAPADFWNTTERPDGGVFLGSSIYNIDATMGAEEAHDSSGFVLRTGWYDETSIADDLRFTETLVGSVDATLTERIRFVEVLDAEQDGDHTDALVYADGLSGQLRVSRLTVETGIFRDDLDGQLWMEFSDAVVVVDALQGEDLPVTSVDPIRFTDALASVSAITGSLADVAVFSDVLGWLWIAESTDTGVVADVLAGVVATSYALSDAVNWADVLSGGLTVYAPALADAGVFSDGLTSQLQLVGVLADTVLFGDALADAAHVVHVVNAETGAVSTYTFTPTIHSMAEYRGVLYLAGPDGLYALDATQDDGEDIVWTLRTGFSDLGTDKLKRLVDVNVQARTQGDLTLQTVHNRTGNKVQRDYRLPPLTRNSHRDGVVHPGMGPVSVYWQFGLRGIGPAEIHQMRLSVEPLSRRR